MMKRLIDLCLALFAGLVFSLPFLAVGLTVKETLRLTFWA